jgi:peroxiredoxin
MSENIIEFTIPDITFKTRVKDEEGNFDWKDVNSRELFKGKKSLVVALPGAFTPTCTSKQLPGYEEKYNEFKEQGVDEIYCLSVNDAFVMHNWGKSLGIKNVKMLPDGNADMTRQMGMLVKKENLGFGKRSWRYAMLIDNITIKVMWIEQNIVDNAEDDPYVITEPDNVLNWLKQNKI